MCICNAAGYLTCNSLLPGATREIERKLHESVTTIPRCVLAVQAKGPIGASASGAVLYEAHSLRRALPVIFIYVESISRYWIQASYALLLCCYQPKSANFTYTHIVNTTNSAVFRSFSVQVFYSFFQGVPHHESAGESRPLF